MALGLKLGACIVRQRRLLTFATVLFGFAYSCALQAQTSRADSPASATTVTTVTQGSLDKISPQSWNLARAAHLLERTGFGGTPEQTQALAKQTSLAAVRQIVYGKSQQSLPAFEPSPIDAAGLDPFPSSRPATTDAAKRDGRALGIDVKPEGSRRLQPVANQFFYWLRASQLETGRLGQWWANRMVATDQPFVEKMALFWHGHFATSEEKVRDVRKMQQQLALYQSKGLGSFRSLLIAAAQDPAMLAYLDAGVNVKGSPNENFAREIMELFTMGIGHYSEHDIREAARAFTGWNFKGLQFEKNTEKHDSGLKTLLGHTGAFDGIQVIDILLEQPSTAEFIAAKMYRYFVREELTSEVRINLGRLLKQKNYDIAAFMEALLLSQDFYSAQGEHIKSPVELAVGTYRRLGLKSLPGMPDFNSTTGNLGQRLFYPPTVAGWPSGRSWITPSALVARGNFVRDILFPDISFIPPDRFAPDPQIREVARRINRGEEMSRATAPEAIPGEQSMSNQMADRDEDFNTRYASFRGYQMALQKVRPILRDSATVQISNLVHQARAKTCGDAVDALVARFMSVPLPVNQRNDLVEWLRRDLGTDQLKVAETYMEDSLRQLLHILLSLPEYQLG
jgi:Protein of unknown function (DUF1800)